MYSWCNINYLRRLILSRCWWLVSVSLLNKLLKTTSSKEIILCCSWNVNMGIPRQHHCKSGFPIRWGEIVKEVLVRAADNLMTLEWTPINVVGWFQPQRPRKTRMCAKVILTTAVATWQYFTVNTCLVALILTPAITWSLGCHHSGPSLVWYKWIYLTFAITIKRDLGIC